MSKNSFTSEEIRTLDDIPDAELLPEAQYPVEIIDVKTKLSKSSSMPMIQLTVKVDPNDYPVDFEPDNAPMGVTSTVYVTGVSLGYDLNKLWRSGKTVLAKLYNACGLSLASVPATDVQPRADLGGHCFVPDATLAVLIGRKLLGTFVYDTDMNGDKIVKMSRYSRLDT